MGPVQNAGYRRKMLEMGSKVRRISNYVCFKKEDSLRSRQRTISDLGFFKLNSSDRTEPRPIVLNNGPLEEVHIDTTAHADFASLKEQRRHPSILF